MAEIKPKWLTLAEAQSVSMAPWYTRKIRVTW